MAEGLANGAQRTERMPSAFIVLSAEDNVGVAIKHIAPGSDVAAGDFSAMTFDERVQVAEAVVAEAGGKVSVAMGVQTTSTRELIRLAKAAK